MSRGKTRMKLLVFNPHFWLKRLRGINDAKNGNKYNNKDTRYKTKQQMQAKVIKYRIRVRIGISFRISVVWGIFPAKYPKLEDSN